MIEKRKVRTEETKATESARMLQEYKIDYIPENWSYVGELENTPDGYKWISNNKCCLSDEYKCALISDELFEKNKDYLTSKGILTKELKICDITFIRNDEGNFVKATVLGFGGDFAINNIAVDGIPYTDYYHDEYGFKYNLKNYVRNVSSKIYTKTYKAINIKDNQTFSYECLTLEDSIKALTHTFTRDWIKNPDIKDPANYIILEKENGDENGIFYRIDINGNIIEKGIR